MIYAKNFTGTTAWGSFIKYIKICLTSICIAVLLTVGVGLLIGFKPIIVKGWSMQPAIMYGDIIIVKKVPLDNLAVGDVITFGSKSYTTHRIVDIDGDMITTKGDPNESNDPSPVDYGHVVGKVIYKSTFIGKVISFIMKSTNIVSLVLVVSAGYLLLRMKETFTEQYLIEE